MFRSPNPSRFPFSPRASGNVLPHRCIAPLSVVNHKQYTTRNQVPACRNVHNLHTISPSYLHDSFQNITKRKNVRHRAIALPRKRSIFCPCSHPLRLFFAGSLHPVAQKHQLCYQLPERALGRAIAPRSRNFMKRDKPSLLVYPCLKHLLLHLRHLSQPFLCRTAAVRRAVNIVVVNNTIKAIKMQRFFKV